MYSPDAGKTWKSLQLNLPTVPVHDLVVKDNDLVVGTHGRSIWILDDLTAIRETTASVQKKSAHLFPVQPTTRWYIGWGGPTREFLPSASGDNPASGAVVWYHLGADFQGEVKIEILDAKGNVIAVASGRKPPESDKKESESDDDDGAPKRKLDPKPGLNKFMWDLTHDGAKVIPGSPADSGNPGTPIPVAPGEYTVRLTLGNQKLTQLTRVSIDPRWQDGARKRFTPPESVIQDELKKQQIPPDRSEVFVKAFVAISVQSKSLEELTSQEALALRVRDDITKLSETVLRIRAIKKQIDLRKELLKDRDDAKGLLKQTDALTKKLNEIEEKLHNPKAKIGYDIFAAKGGAMLYSQFTWLLSNLTEGDGAPTKAQQELAAELEKELSGLLGQFDALVKGDLAKCNDAAKKLGVPELYVPPATKTGAKPPEKK